MISAAGTTHGSANPDDQRVPLLFLGQGVKPGRYERPATPADLAPTLAAIVGVSLKAEGTAVLEIERVAWVRCVRWVGERGRH